MKTIQISTRNHIKKRNSRYESTNGIDFDNISLENTQRAKYKKKK